MIYSSSYLSTSFELTNLESETYVVVLTALVPVTYYTPYVPAIISKCKLTREVKPLQTIITAIIMSPFFRLVHTRYKKNIPFT